MPSGYQQVVQHLEGGIVGKIPVAEGDIVHSGQELIALSGAGVLEDLERARTKQVSLQMQEERLRSFIEKRQPDFSAFSEEHRNIVRDQVNFFSSMTSVNNEERKIIADQIEQKRRVIATLSSELSTAQQNLVIARELFSKREKLHGKGYLSDTKYLEARQGMNAVEGDISQIRSRISVAQAEIAEYRNRLSSLGFSQKDRANERLDAVVTERLQHEETLRKLEDRSARLSIRAPIGGVVKGLAVNTIGAVVKPGEVLMEIVPVDKDLVVQVKIPPQHIGHVHLEQPVKVKFSSFDFSRYGLVDGKLEQISATTFSGEGGERYYQGRIKLERSYVGKDKANMVVPGMTVMAEIVTGEKTILQYLLKPIHNSLKTAFSER